MKLAGFFILTFLIASVGSNGQTAATPPPNASHQEIKTIKTRFAVGTMGQGEEFIPAVGRPGSWPGIVVVPDSSGLNDEARRQARSLAAQGYLVLAVDLYDGLLPSSREEGDKWMNALSEPDAVSKIQAAISFVQNWMMVPEKVGVIAWGLGGTYALRVAAIEQKLKTVIVNYGPVSQDGFILSNITSPVLVNIGALDTTSSVERINAFTKSLKSSSRKDVKIYPNAAYNFEDIRSEDVYQAADAIDAEKRTALFLGKWISR